MFALTESMVVPARMATGLGMTSEEWAELRSKVDDSFWVMRIIGIVILARHHHPHLTDRSPQDTLPFRTTMMASRAGRTEITVV